MNINSAYDRLPARLWRAPDLGLSKAHVRYAPMRVECPEHGVLAERAPWARRAESRMTSSFEDQLAWGAAQMGKKAASGLWRVSRRTVGSACVRVAWAREGHGKEVLALFLDELDGADGGEARALPDRWLSRACR